MKEKAQIKDDLMTVTNLIRDITNMHNDAKDLSFSPKLEAQMTAYEAGIKTVLANKTEQTPEENKAAIARNNASTKYATAHEEATKARGKVNQQVKSKLIW